MRLFLSGDVMTGRGIDQILATPGDPTLHESWAKSALRYVELAERTNGPLPRQAGPEYVWGDALEVLEEAGVDARIVNLETALTDGGDPWPGKGIHYRMHPGNLDVLRTAGIDCCVLANNHVLDWSYPGLHQTLDSLQNAGIATTGAGADLDEARRPTVIETATGPRVIVIAVGLGSSGIPADWAASTDRAGVWLLPRLDDAAVTEIDAALSAVKEEDDVTVVSIHWGPNWGYEIPEAHKRFARALIDEAAVDVVHGHSSHHPIGLEVHRDRPILYGCGDLINDYEGIGGHEEYRPGLGLLYLTTLDHGGLRELEMVPVRLRRFRLERAGELDTEWLAQTLTRVSEELGTGVERAEEGRLHAVW